MLKLIFMFFIGCIILSNGYSKNLLSNFNINNVSSKGIPKTWYLRDVNSEKLQKNKKGEYIWSINSINKAKPSFILRHNLPVVVNKNYEIEMKIQTGPGVKFKLYVESPKTFICFKTKYYEGTGKWQNLRLIFRYKKGQMPKKPYLAIIVKGIGKLKLTSPYLQEINCKFTNGNFSNGLKDWKIEKANASIDEIGGKIGKALKLYNIKNNIKPRIVYKNIFLKGDKNYQITYSVKGSSNKKITDSMAASWFRVYPEINGKAISIESSKWQDCFSAWHKKKVSFELKKDSYVDLVCEVRAPGEAWIANIKLYEKKKYVAPIELALDLPLAFHNGIFSSQKHIKNLTGIVQVNKPGISSIKLSLDGKEVKIIPKGKQTAFSITIPQATGSYQLKAIAYDKNNKKIAKSELEFNVYPKAKKEVTFRKDRVMLVNNKPFFPIGSWPFHGKRSSDKKFEALSKAGFNICMNGDPQRAASYGLFTMLRLRESIPKHITNNSKLLKKWKQIYMTEMRRISNHSSVLLFFISDEPAWRGIPPKPIIRAYKFYKEINPYLPTLLNSAPRGSISTLRVYRDGFDVYGIDIYPIPAPNSHSGLKDKMMTSVGKYTDICREVVEDRKPVWMTLQGFSWADISNKKGALPTEKENRFMIYNSILHGATGLFWWGINHGGNADKFLPILSKTLYEIKVMSSVLVAHQMKAQLTTENKHLRFMQRRLNGVNYYFVINESGKKFNAKFKGKFPKQLTVLFEKRSIETNGKKFTDDFAPYGVHIYADKPGLPPKLAQPELNRNFIKKNKVDYGKDYKQANWIWYPKKSGQAGHKACFKRKINIPENFKKVEFFITADDFYSFYLNGKLAGDDRVGMSGWSKLDFYDLSSKVKSGENLFEINAFDGGDAPCGLLCVIKVTDNNGKSSIIVSDEQFLSSEAEKNNWVAAENICKYGKGAWGDKLIIKKKDNKYLGKIK